jgi:quercetin dioxygenase-like cupin family protein
VKVIRSAALVAVLIGGGLALHAAQSQQTGIKRTPLVQHDLSVPGREVLQVRVDFDPGVTFPAHTHPGEEVAYVIDGSLEYQFEGQPPITLKAGQSLVVPAGTVHTAKNVGSTTAGELATYIVEKGKPLVTFKPARP